jgi:hypothetical protein
MGVVRRKIERGGDNIWALDDFADLPSTAVAQALSRLTCSKALERLSKDVYYRPQANEVRQEPGQADCNSKTGLPPQERFPIRRCSCQCSRLVCQR